MLPSSKRLQLAPGSLATADASVSPGLGAVAHPAAGAGVKRPHESGSQMSVISPPALIKRRLVHSPQPAGVSVGKEEQSPRLLCAHGCQRGVGHVGLCLTEDGVQPPNAKLMHAAAKRFVHRDDDWVWTELEEVACQPTPVVERQQ